MENAERAKQRMEVVTELLEVYGRTATPRALVHMVKAVEDYTIECLERTVPLMIQRHEFFSVAKLIECLNEVTGQIELERSRENRQARTDAPKISNDEARRRAEES